MLVSTGGIYRTRSGKKVGPLRPFRDKEDAPARDIMGRSAWFYVDGVGAFDKHGLYLTGGVECPHDLTAEVDGLAPIDGHIERHEDDRELTVGTSVPLGVLLAEVRVRGAEVAIDRAWLEASAGSTVPLEGTAIDTFGIFHAGRWRPFRSVITAAALSEARAS
ncbi:hypothetical protein NKH10_19295 [Mesorhizobium sp. M1340]|uniref:hypothetical protein n=1 Tax=Mesorhizobium sp. M1340 TaxID=2957087 RepID=UPI003334E84F